MKSLNYILKGGHSRLNILLFIVILTISFTVWMAPADANVASAASSRLAYWHLDEASGPSYADAESGGHDGVCTTCPAATSSGQVNGAQVFNGVDTTIDIAAHPDFDWSAGDTFSVEAWVQPNACSGGDEVFVGRGSGGGGHWSLGCAGSTGMARFELSDGSASVQLDSTKVINNGAWRHLVGVYDGANNQAYLYVDGQDQQSTATSFSGSFAQSSDDLNFGHLNGSFYFDGTLDEVAVYDLALPDAEIGAHYYLSRAYDNACGASVSIMPLGDSITLGNNSGEDDVTKQVSYRRDLWQSLFSNGYDVDFVGSLTNGEYYQPLEGFDPEHEGHAGWTDDQIASNVQGWLTSTPADVVLLHIGTNGFDTSEADVETILDEIDLYSEKVTVLLARIIQTRDGTPNVTPFNDNVEAMANSRIAAGDKIIMVNMETGAGINYSQYPPGDMWNNLHPYATGYAKMGALWQTTLAGFLPTCEAAPAITSTAVTSAIVDQPYTYDVEATGQPAPVFSLTSAPPGMTINAAAGVIEWTPTAPGVYNVEVAATNSSGSDAQPYTITVMGTPTAAQCTDPDLAAYWKLDDGTGSTTFADAANNHDGSCSSPTCPAATTGQVDGAFLFDGADQVDVPDADAFDWSNTDSFSVALWVNTSQACTGNDVFVGKYQGGGDVAWWLGCNDGDNVPRFVLRDSSGDVRSIKGAAAINDGNWHHVVAVRDGSTTINRLYVDGSQVAFTGTNYSGGFVTNVPLNIGYYDAGYHFTGLLDEIAVYQRALSGSEIQQQYNNGLAGYGYEYDTVWGGGSGDWHTAGNWTNAVPTQNDAVFVPAGTAQLGADGATACLQVENGATVDLGTHALTVENGMTNDGTLRQTKTAVSAFTQFLHITDIAGSGTKYRGVELTPSENIGDVTVSVRAIDPGAGEYCTGSGGSSPDYAERCFDISPTVTNPSNPVTVRLYADTAYELNGIAEADLAVFHHTGGGVWSELSGATGNSGDGYSYAQGLAGSFSAFLLGETNNDPTAVHLSNFHVLSPTGIELILSLLGLLSLTTVLLWRRRAG